MTVGSSDTTAPRPKTVARRYTFATHRTAAKLAERANTQTYLREPCAALGVGRPAGSGCEFEHLPSDIKHDGLETTGDGGYRGSDPGDGARRLTARGR